MPEAWMRPLNGESAWLSHCEKEPGLCIGFRDEVPQAPR